MVSLESLLNMEVESYDMFEKFMIAKKFLVPKQLKNCGLGEFLSFTDDALSLLIQEYTYEAGVRALERRIENVCTHQTLVAVENQSLEIVEIGPKEIASILGPPDFKRYMSRPMPAGCCNGLAVAGYVGMVSVVETQLISRKSGELFTGVGEKIKDSVEKALSSLESVNEKFQTKIKQHFTGGGIHFNMGDGSNKIEGPSAGIAILCAFFSLFSKISIREKLAMTGAIGLTMGDVSEVGGIKEKAIGAMCAGITELILPEANRLHFEKIDERIKDKFEKVYFVSSIEEVLKIVFGENYKDVKFE